MATTNGSAEIVNMEAARARRRASELDGDEFPTAGAYLRAVREQSGYSLEEISERTHIKAVYLEAIEEMALDGLPSRPFAIGFAKVYAEALGIDARALVARFKEDAGYSAAVEVEPEKFEAAQAAAEGAERSDLSLPAIIAIFAFFIWCAFQLTVPRPGNEATPYKFGAESLAAPGLAGAAAPAPSPDMLRGAPPAPLPEVVEAALIDPSEPVYPRRCEAGAAAVETVEIAFNVSAEGAVRGERVAASSNPCFNDAALNAARLWRFSPRTVDGAPRTAYDLRHIFRFEKPV